MADMYLGPHETCVTYDFRKYYVKNEPVRKFVNQWDLVDQF